MTLTFPDLVALSSDKVVARAKKDKQFKFDLASLFNGKAIHFVTEQVEKYGDFIDRNAVTDDLVRDRLKKYNAELYDNKAGEVDGKIVFPEEYLASINPAPAPEPAPEPSKPAPDVKVAKNEPVIKLALNIEKPAGKEEKPAAEAPKSTPYKQELQPDKKPAAVKKKAAPKEPSLSQFRGDSDAAAMNRLMNEFYASGGTSTAVGNLNRTNETAIASVSRGGNDEYVPAGVLAAPAYPQRRATGLA
ncbi:MAG TPA: hypothetical protein VHB73_03245 [Alphaproteobacteria bacterium]|nr:hypothetical protein [Alphaproteobacteria bacterium]